MLIFSPHQHLSDRNILLKINHICNIFVQSTQCFDVLLYFNASTCYTDHSYISIRYNSDIIININEERSPLVAESIKRLKVAFLGLGLIGGSIAMTIRRVFPNAEIIALNRSEIPLNEALKAGIIDVGVHKVDDVFKNCDFIFLCMPVNTNIDYLKKIEPYLTDKTVLTDVGSVKGVIHDAVEKILPNAHFIGGHPMAGSEKSGFSNANDRLIENAYYILTPSAAATAEDVQKYQELVSSLDAIPLVIPPSDHDFYTAAVSHVPHLIAYTLVQLVKEMDSPEQYMKLIAAGGFKDITRIASSDATMWEQICMENPENIRKLLHEYISRLQHIDDLIEARSNSKLHDFFSDMKNYRDSIRENKGVIPGTYDLHCDIIDEAGAIATIATALSVQGISIKNIGIVHNRTFEQGALHIQFYDAEAKNCAAAVLKKYNYTVYPY